MSLAERLAADTKTAMKEGVASRVAVLRLLSNALQQERIKLGKDLDDAAQLKVLQREAKQRRDSLAQFKAAGRDDLAQAEEMELALIDEYLPRQMPAEELQQLVAQVIEDTGADGMAQMGVVIGQAMQRAEGRADGAAVSAAVRAQLAQQ